MMKIDAYEAYNQGSNEENKTQVDHEKGKKNAALLLSQARSEEPGQAPPVENGEIISGAADIDKGGNGNKNGTTTKSFTTVTQNGANINITNINNHHTYVIYR